MNKIILISLLFCITVAVTGQDLSKHDKVEIKQAQEYFENKNYVDSYDIYWELFENYPENPEVQYGVGICKLNISGEEKSALPYLIKAKDNVKYKNVLFYLAQAYHVNHSLDEALIPDHAAIPKLFSFVFDFLAYCKNNGYLKIILHLIYKISILL